MPERLGKTEVYERFTAACRRGDVEAMRSFVADGFTANFPGYGWLDFDRVVEYFGRLRGISSDFATLEPAVQQGAMDDDVMYVRYELGYHVGSHHIILMCVDEVTFEGDRIKQCYVFYDRVAAREQAGITDL